MTDTPTSKVEALREQVGKILDNYLSTASAYESNNGYPLVASYEDHKRIRDEAIANFATFLEVVQSQAETFSKDGKPLSDTNSIEAVPVEALHQQQTKAKGDV